MKNLFTLFLLLSVSGLFAQPVTSANSKYIIDKLKNEVSLATKAELSNNNLLEEYTVQLINNKLYLSIIATVNNGFDSNELPKQVIFGSRAANIVTLKVSIYNLDLIEAIKGIDIFEVASKIIPQIKKAIVDLRADSVHEGLVFNQTKYSGEGVIIGITDWGFDYTHPMFYDSAQQHTRIIASWDQFKQGGNKPNGFSYGAEHVGETELLAAQSDSACLYYNYATHGSHVAGIAGGRLDDLALSGPAYGANFLFTQILLDEGAVIDAMNWMKEKAAQENKRLVINMSWGLYHLGNMDGTSMLSQAMDNLANDGVVVVTSAGNNGDTPFHIQKEFTLDTIFSRVGFDNFASNPAMFGQNVIMWGEENEAFCTAVEVYNGTNLLARTKFYCTSDMAGNTDTIIYYGSDSLIINVVSEANNPLNKRPHLIFSIQNRASANAVVIRSTASAGTVNYWNVTHLTNGAGNWGQPFMSAGAGSTLGDEFYSLGAPASTKSAISIAAHNSEFLISQGNILNGSIAHFSSYGPTLDGRIKPEVSAPGVGVVSSISSFTTRSYNGLLSYNFKGRTYDFAAFSGTSMSSPCVTGVVALLLEANPNLSPLEIKEILKNTARQDDKTGVLPVTGSTQWGWGKVTATRAINEAVRLVGIELPIEDQLVVYPNPSSNVLFVDGAQCILDATKNIYSIDGRKVISTTDNQINISFLSNGIYLIKIETSNGLVTKKLVKE